jgi:hypothetical protein
LRHGRGVCCAALLLLMGALALRVAAQTPIPPALSLAQVLEKMQLHDQHQKEHLQSYRAVRHYHAEYRGYGKDIAAEMEVEVDFNAVSGKSFRILSQSGSKLLCDKVLKRAIDSEKEAAGDKGATALTPANYKFQLEGTESLDGQAVYILDATPLKESKFLYRGKVWVDAVDFAVVKLEVEPSKNPSFWLSRPRIHSTSAKTGDFWLPQKMRSETNVRFGGTAVLVIDYGIYKIVPDALTHTAED